MSPFEKWVEDVVKPLSEISYSHFSESIMCFNVKAYRSSFMSTYLGFFKYLEALAKRSDRKPPSLSIDKWKVFLASINNEKTWEPTIFNEIRNQKSLIFVIEKHISDKFVTFKETRNDCAHGRDESVTYHHIEIFRSFILNNYLKFTIEGSEANFFQRLKDHFDITITSRTKPYDDLINEIQYLGINDYLVFFEKISDILDKNNVYKDVFYNKVLSIYYKVPEINSSLKEILLGRNHTDFWYFEKFPEDFIKIHFTSKEIRAIWYRKIYLNSSIGLRIDMFKILLSNNFVDESDKKEFFSRFVVEFDQTGYKNFILTENEVGYFNNNFFLEAIHEYFFNLSNERDAYKKADLIAFYFNYSRKINDVEIQFLNDYLSNYALSYYNHFFKDAFQMKCFNNQSFIETLEDVKYTELRRRLV